MEHDLKTCSKCGNEYPADTTHFVVEKKVKSGLGSRCRNCRREQQRDYMRKRRTEEPEAVDAYRRNWEASHQEWRKEYAREYRLANRERDRVRLRRWREEHPALNREYDRKYSTSDSYRERKRIYLAEKRANDPTFHLNAVVGTSIANSLKGQKNGRSWESLVGYTLEDLMQHLEVKFRDGMVWDNYGEWHIDHIIPKSWFRYESPDDHEFKKCWSLKNLQPLWGSENCSKGARL